MGYEIRTLGTLATQATEFFTQAVQGSIVRLWPNTFRVFGKVFSLLDFEHEMRRQWLFKQMFASTADLTWLARHGYELGLAPDAGSAATGSVSVSAPVGTVVPAGVGFSRSDGATYTTLIAVTATSGTIDLTVQSDLAGSAYDTGPGDTLDLVADGNSPIGLGITATVDPSGLTGGTDSEDVETFRGRVLYRKRNPPQGGSAADYTQWTGEALSTVKAVYVDSFVNDARSVWVCFTVSDQSDSLPSDAEVATVQNYVSDSIRRPVTARVFVTAPTPEPVDIVIGNVSPLTSAVQAGVLIELKAMFADEVQPATPSTSFTLYREQVESAIARTFGLGHFTLISPTADLTYTVGGQMPVLNTIIYQ